MKKQNSFKKILIAADLTEMDDQLLTFVRQLSDQVSIEKIYLAHIIPNMLVPANADLEFHKMFSLDYPINEKVRDVLVGKSDQYFEGSGVEFGFEVVEGKAYKTLMKMIKLKEIDLLVLGNKSDSEGSGITAKRIARNAPCHVLFVPDKVPSTINKILVPIDFSENSKRALESALSFKNKKTDVTALNIVKILGVDYYYGLAGNNEFRAAMKASAWDSFSEFVISKGFSDSEFEKDVILNQYNNVAREMKEYLAHHNFDFVVMGAKGHTAFENFLMGSVTESFVNTFNELPILIIR